MTREVADPKIEKPTDAVITLDEAPQAYDQFDKRVEGWTKVLLHPVGA